MAKNSFIEIDKESLDDEWVEQPALFRRYSRLLAKATKKVGVAKANLDVVMAEVAMDIRVNYTTFGLKKVPSDAVTKQVALMDKRVKTAQSALIEAKYEEDQYQADVNALAQRKSGLQDLVVLWLQDYWAEPRVKGDNDSIRDHLRDRELKEHYKRGRLPVDPDKPKNKKKPNA